ncbi:MAG TPA: geranylgeranylglyceryl/heptaprenylglyceryl phosphate synthase [Methanomicrobia archaeon]|nr:geranylgeranylglyceryl/heptaprenylglyceryl phosphate synthase [Methanomicrobia archaeon]
MTGRVETSILDMLARGKLHFTLLDPDDVTPERARKIVTKAEDAGTSAIMIGGSTNATGPNLDAVVQAIKATTSLPVILFPGGASAITPHADAIFFMSILNSRNPYFITKSQALGAIPVKQAGIEPIPMAYLVTEPGMTVGYIGEADLLPRNKPAIAATYALAGQYMGMRFVYLEAGSGADAPAPAEMIGVVKHVIDVPLIVGGGITTPEQARTAVMAGADIIVTGTLAENDPDMLASIINAIDV